MPSISLITKFQTDKIANVDSDVDFPVALGRNLKIDAVQL
jgi:hypothetical protein